MQRIIILIDGTWNREGVQADTNVAKLDPRDKKCLQRLIKPKATDGTLQEVFYHDGVGNDGGIVERLLGGAIGLGLKKIVRACYEFIVNKFNPGDEIYIFGFSRGAYAARALAGMIGASLRRPRGLRTRTTSALHYSSVSGISRHQLRQSHRRWIARGRDRRATAAIRPNILDYSKGPETARACRTDLVRRSSRQYRRQLPGCGPIRSCTHLDDCSRPKSGRTGI